MCLKTQKEYWNYKEVSALLPFESSFVHMLKKDVEHDTSAVLLHFSLNLDMHFVQNNPHVLDSYPLSTRNRMDQL